MTCGTSWKKTARIPIRPARYAPSQTFLLHRRPASPRQRGSSAVFGRRSAVSRSQRDVGPSCAPSSRCTAPASRRRAADLPPSPGEDHWATPVAAVRPADARPAPVEPPGARRDGGLARIRPRGRRAAAAHSAARTIAMHSGRHPGCAGERGAEPCRPLPRRRAVKLARRARHGGKRALAPCPSSIAYAAAKPARKLACRATAGCCRWSLHVSRPGVDRLGFATRGRSPRTESNAGPRMRWPRHVVGAA